MLVGKLGAIRLIRQVSEKEGRRDGCVEQDIVEDKRDRDCGAIYILLGQVVDCFVREHRCSEIYDAGKTLRIKKRSVLVA